MMKKRMERKKDKIERKEKETNEKSKRLLHLKSTDKLLKISSKSLFQNQM